MSEGAEFGEEVEPAELLRLPADRMGFVRRECPACHRQFKVRQTSLDGEEIFNRLHGQVNHCNEHEGLGCAEAAVRCCPYCGSRAADGGWFTAEQRAWLDKRAQSFGEELRYEQLAHVERTLSVNPYPTFLALRPKKPTVTLRPEPDDMRLVPLLCCGESLKVTDTWVGTLTCFYCGCEHDYAEALIRQRLSRILT